MPIKYTVEVFQGTDIVRHIYVDARKKELS